MLSLKDVVLSHKDVEPILDDFIMSHKDPYYYYCN